MEKNCAVMKNVLNESVLCALSRRDLQATLFRGKKPSVEIAVCVIYVKKGGGNKI